MSKPDRKRDPNHPGWSKKQRMMFLTACTAAGWDSAQRYIIMHHCGCPLDPDTKRPSVKHPRNSNNQFALVMSFAEPVARDRGKPIHPPSKFKSWGDAVEDKAANARHKARTIIAEAIERAPGAFDNGLEAWVVTHVCSHDESGFIDFIPDSIDQCDAPTLYRIIECMRAFVGRKFKEMDIVPRSFTIPRSAIERAARRTG